MKKNIKITAISLLVLSSCTPAPKLGVNTVDLSTGDLEYSQTEGRYLQNNGKIGGTESAYIHSQATVEKIDYAKRTATIKTQDGKLTNMAVSKDAVNFEQVKAGDKVLVDYYVSVEFEARQPTAEEMEMNNKAVMASIKAPKGEKPTIAGIEEGVTVVTVENIDKKNGFLVIKSTTGDMYKVTAKYPENLSYVKQGDKIVIKKTEALAARVVPVM